MSVKHNRTFIVFIIVLGRHVSFLIESSTGPAKKIDPCLKCLKMRGSIFLEGPEDDSIRIETCCPSTIINIKVLFCLIDISLYFYICVKHFGTANFKKHIVVFIIRIYIII